MQAEEDIKGIKHNKSVACPSSGGSLHPVSVVKVQIASHIALLLVAFDVVQRVCAWLGCLEPAFGARINFVSPDSQVPLLLCHHLFMEKDQEESLFGQHVSQSVLEKEKQMYKRIKITKFTGQRERILKAIICCDDFGHRQIGKLKNQISHKNIFLQTSPRACEFFKVHIDRRKKLGK